MFAKRSPSFPAVRLAVVAGLLPVLATAFGTGCSQRRTSLRPVYLSPSTSAPAYPSLAPVGRSPASLDTSATRTGSVSSVVVEPVPEAAPSSPMTITPAPGGLRSGSGASPYPSKDSPPPVTPPVVSPGPLSDEPGYLEPTSPAGSTGAAPATPSDERVPSATPGPESPSSYADPRSRSGRASGTNGPRLRQASLSVRDEVQSYVNDPDDLFAPPKADKPWKYVVLHHSASPTGGYASIDRDHRQRLRWDGCGYHFVIGNGTDSPDGRIEVAHRWTVQKNGVHCRDGKSSEVNEYGIGVCLVGDLDKNPPTEKQVASARALIAYLDDRYAIPADRVETHAHLASAATDCPGRYFPTQAILGSPGLSVR